ncbi:helix-turn-helix domain-containing protein [Vibrio rhizosphaerae]|uniref:Helix-turn-helix transcriptional regulator n=1 Tax=Vibrio rhizosphaerae TaxID=398736 RepID=A0ABU4IXQ9_9VIBR|nr:helix-turn-helix transcriptional regulator [Vibrio rhizosphaerae]MDW6094194.1 helix-turn-helix transcriptional regulator [Vibrio rhizosphaerae]
MHPTVIFIRKILKSKGLSYARLATLSGIDESKIKRVLSGRQSMTLEMRDQIMVVLGVAEMTQADHLNSAEYLTLWHQMPPNLKQVVLSLMTTFKFETQRS